MYLKRCITCVLKALTLPMLRLLLPKAQGWKDFFKPFKPCHVGIHWKALFEYSKMSTHVLGFQTSFRSIASFYISKISNQQHKGYTSVYHRFNYFHFSKVFAKHNVIVLSDEIYGRLHYQHKHDTLMRVCISFSNISTI